MVWPREKVIVIVSTSNTRSFWAAGLVANRLASICLARLERTETVRKLDASRQLWRDPRFLADNPAD